MAWYHTGRQEILDAEVERWTVGEMNNCQPIWPLLVHGLREHQDGGVVSCGGERADFSHAEFVAVAVGAAGNVMGVWEEGAEEAAFVMEIAVYCCCDQDFGRWRGGVGGG